MLLLDKNKFFDSAKTPGRKAQVRVMLRGAVKLELSTLPPYLTGAFSIKPGTNREVAALVTSVAVEEMLHMALAANTLIAVGGKPRIMKYGLSLAYPGHLPMQVDTGLMVSLGSLTTTQVHDVFMEIEAPDTSAVLPGEAQVSSSVALRAKHSYGSIGDFYMAIIEKLEQLVVAGDDPFANPSLDRQVDLARWFAGELPRNPTGKVHNLDTARYNLETIIRQGEGANVGSDPINPMDTTRGQGSLAHYFKFGEIYFGHRLVPDPSAPSGWSYTGAPVPLDPSNVYDFPANAALSTYPAGSAAAISGEQFYEAYLRLLSGLDRAFNGQPHMLADAIGTMYELKLIAQQVVLHPADPNNPSGPVAAPPFQRHPAPST